MSTFNHNKNKSAHESRRLVIIAGYYGFDNLGDEAILEELVNELSSLCDRQSIVVLSNNPQKTTSLFRVKSINRWQWFDYLKVSRQAKLLISGGGGLFQDRTGFGSVIFYSAQILLAHFCGAKVLIYAQGLGPLQNAFSKALTHFAFKQTNKITVRDNNSLNTIKAWSLEGHLTADPVWSLSPSPLPQSAYQVIETVKRNTKGLTIGLSIRQDSHLKSYHLYHLTKSLIDALPKQSTILLLPFQLQQDQQPLQTVEQFFSQSSINTKWLEPNLFTKPSQWLTLMENFDLLIGMRFHAVLMALKVNKPVIGIAYDQKVSNLLLQFKQPELSLAADENQCQTEWPKTIKTAISARASLIDVSKNILIANKQLADQNIKSLAEILEVGTTGNVASINN